MSLPTPTDDLSARLRTMQIILGAILLGAVAFLVIAVALRWGSTPVDPPVLTYVMLAVGLVLAVMYHFVADWVATSQRRTIAPQAGSPGALKAWSGAYQTTLIASAACLEAAAVAQIVAYYLEANWVSRLAAIGFLAVLATLFPTRAGVERWIAEQREALARKPSGQR